MDERNESWHQRQLIQWARQFTWGQFLFHIPNETVGGQRWIVRNRQLGCRKGVPDLMLPIPMHGYHGMFIEMKKIGGRLDRIQQKWIRALNELGYLAICCHGWEEARDALSGYMDTKAFGEKEGRLQEASGGWGYNGHPPDLLSEYWDNDRGIRIESE